MDFTSQKKKQKKMELFPQLCFLWLLHEFDHVRGIQSCSSLVCPQWGNMGNSASPLVHHHIEHEMAVNEEYSPLPDTPI